MELHNIIVTIPGETIGSLVVCCDLLINQEEDTASHPDALIKSFVTDITVTKIRMVEYHVFDKVGIVMTSRFTQDKKLKALLENQIIEEVEYKNLNDLKTAA